ncbi:hypothetical protein CVN76_03915 [Bacillus sp. mrc49]|nr:hypothetical protein CVN76_03915 [Bacillus sp. mrc49]
MILKFFFIHSNRTEFLLLSLQAKEDNEKSLTCFNKGQIIFLLEKQEGVYEHTPENCRQRGNW